MAITKNVCLRGIVKEFAAQRGGERVRALDDVSLDIEEGEFITLLGPSGCGKTTALRVIAGLDTPDAGDVWLGGARITEVAPERRDTAMVFQGYALFPHFSVRENLAYGLRLRRLSRAEIDRRVGEAMASTGLEELSSRLPAELSGGEQQRLALARALVIEPSVLLFDEPLSSLDAKLRMHMRAELRRITSQLRMTSIFVTHDQAEALSLSDRVVVMNRGRVEQVGSPEEVYERPASEFVATFVGSANLLEGELMARTQQLLEVSLWGARLAVPWDAALRPAPGRRVRLVIRPESVLLTPDGRFEASVADATFTGGHLEYALEVGGTLLTATATRTPGARRYRLGERVRFDLAAEAMCCVGSTL